MEVQQIYCIAPLKILCKLLKVEKKMKNSLGQKVFFKDTNSKLKNIQFSTSSIDEHAPKPALNIEWVFSSFKNLNVNHLYSLLELREDIFIVEQNVPYKDIDGKDLHCIHLMGFLEGELSCYMRLVPLDIFEKGYFSLGRVTVKSSLRNLGVGKKLVLTGLNYLDKIRNKYPIKISSQLYLREFYATFGFAAQGEPYIEDRILHIAMYRD